MVTDGESYLTLAVNRPARLDDLPSTTRELQVTAAR